MNAQKFELIIRTVIDVNGHGISSMKVNGVASAAQLIVSLEQVIEGIKLEAEKKNKKPLEVIQ